MDGTAIKEISDLAVSAASGSTNIIGADFPTIVIPDNYGIQDLEHLQDKPYLFRASYSTNNLDDFVGYVGQYHLLNLSKVFVDPDQIESSAILDLGTPENPQWGKHKAALKLEKSPEYSALLKANNTNYSQKDLIDFMEDYADHITFIDDDLNIVPFKSGIQSLRKLKTLENKQQESSVGNFAQSHSALESIEIKAAGEAIPFGFKFDVFPYEGLKLFTVVSQIRASNSGKDVLLKYRISSIDKLKKEIAEDFKKKIIDALKSEIDVYIGRFTYQ
ncbi:MAG: DUF2303 family protein [Methylococcales bacterium]